MENGFDRAFGYAGLAIDAFIRVDEQQLLALVKAFDGTYYNAVCVFAVEARFSNHVSH